MEKSLINNNMFEDIKHIDEFGNEFWYARELQLTLKYSQRRRFNEVIEKAKTTCNISNFSISNHFADIGKMVKTGDSVRIISDYKLSRYACYLIAQNGDSRKPTIAFAQTYFAIQTRKQELLQQEYNNLTEDEKRFYQRNLTKKGNYSLNQIGQIQVYMNYIDKHLKTINQDKIIGIIICKEDNEYVIKYCSDKRINSRVYELV